jgi:hypothetical protein
MRTADKAFGEPRGSLDGHQARGARWRALSRLLDPGERRRRSSRRGADVGAGWLAAWGTGRDFTGGCGRPGSAERGVGGRPSRPRDVRGDIGQCVRAEGGLTRGRSAKLAFRADGPEVIEMQATTTLYAMKLGM